MPVTFLYMCKGCAREFEVDHRLEDESRHLLDSGEVCGTLRRVWAVNFKRVPGGGRD